MATQSEQIRNLIVGTAGHIDHGKTALVKALTGVDADRFPEEKQRGITIDIGFAELELGDVRIGFVDVPGHEKFVKNMLAGASGIDVVMLIVAADEGVMPQTREHFEICRLLGVKHGIVVLTKKDLVDDELLELVSLDVHELIEGSFLETAPAIAVSSKTGEGLEELRTRLAHLAGEIPPRNSRTIARLPIDRSFSIKGFGAVATGTLVSGEIVEGSELELLPAGRRTRVRGLQTHAMPVKIVHAGQRTAVNLGGIEYLEIERGMVLAEPDVLRPTQIVDCEVEVLKDAARPLRSRQRVRVHIGTVEALARVQVLNEAREIAPGSTDFVQLRLESPVVCVPGERFILRFYSPQMTIAGGRVLDNSAIRCRLAQVESARGRLAQLAQDDPVRRIRIYVETAGDAGLNFQDLQARTGWRKAFLDEAITESLAKRSIIKTESVYLSRTPFEDLRSRTLAAIEAFHRREPLARGMARETLRERVFSRLKPDVFKSVLASLESDRKIVSEKDNVRAADHSLELSGDEEIVRTRLSNIFKIAGLEVPKLDEALVESVRGTRIDRHQARKVFQLLLNTGDVVKVNEEFYFSKATIDGLVAKLRGFADKSPSRLVDVTQFKDLAGVSRKYAIPLLEYFDREKITRRAADKRIVS
ncbi:MAG: selenocysteine-specific translation elongation factor [Acidobacteria bacterium]|nr:selenocysteine-specific translation elongation factor [Acidobacteriota bacterium]